MRLTPAQKRQYRSLFGRDLQNQRDAERQSSANQRRRVSRDVRCRGWVIDVDLGEFARKSELNFVRAFSRSFQITS